MQEPVRYEREALETPVKFLRSEILDPKIFSRIYPVILIGSAALVPDIRNKAGA